MHSAVWLDIKYMLSPFSCKYVTIKLSWVELSWIELWLTRGQHVSDRSAALTEDGHGKAGNKDADTEAQIWDLWTPARHQITRIH